MKEYVEADVASESGSEEYSGESPRSVGKWRVNKLGVVHNQVLKIMEEDSHLGEDIIKDNIINGQIRFVSSAVDVMLSSRLILPSSPLSGKTPVKTSP
ncbi:hypothetical protein M5689_002990 [Euphorbia peplus]|nr:hypothetical protein M5689_002990 [Euphorbia peplus]